MQSHTHTLDILFLKCMLFALLIPFSVLVTNTIHTTYIAMESKIFKGFALATDATLEPGSVVVYSDSPETGQSGDRMPVVSTFSLLFRPTHPAS